jgi:rubredoxin
LSPADDQGGAVAPMGEPGGAAASTHEAATCSVCGLIGAADTGWMRETDAAGRARWVCPACARRHICAIEARLDQEWW